MNKEVFRLKAKCPANWDTLPFGDAIKDATGGKPKVKKGSYKQNGSLAVIDQGQGLIGGYIDDESLVCKEKLPCILFGDHTKIFKFIDQPFALGADGVKVLVPKGEFDKRFLYHYLNTLKLPDNAGYSRHFKFLKEKAVVKPPLAEQKRIAAILDKADAIRRKRRQAIQLADEFLRSVFLDMFGDPMTNPKGYNSESLGDLVKIISGGTPSKAKKRFWNGMFPWVSPKDMKSITISNSIDKISKIVFSETPLKRIPQKSILIVIRGMILAHTIPIAITEKEVAINQDIKALIPKQPIVPQFLLWSLIVMHNFLLSKVSTAAHGTKRLDMESLKNTDILLPTIVQQNQFVEIVNKFSSVKSGQALSLKQNNAMFNSLSQRAFQGEL